MYKELDVVELKDGTIATIVVKHTDKDFTFELPNTEEWLREGTVDDIKRKVA